MKRDRQKLIIDYIENNNVSTQDEIIKMLEGSGYKVTQATISRDIKDLKLVKEHFGKNKTRYVISKSETHNNFAMIFSRSVLSVELAMNIVVVKCYVGTANAACVALENVHMSGVVGAIAGDDTIFLACDSIENAEANRNVIISMLKD